MYMNLFVKGFNKATTEEELLSFFSKFGPVKSFRMQPNGTAYVCYNDRETAKLALDQARHHLFMGHYLIVDFYQPKELRQLQMEESIDKRQYDERKKLDLLHSPVAMAGDSGARLIIELINSLSSMGRSGQPYQQRRGHQPPRVHNMRGPYQQQQQMGNFRPPFSTQVNNPPAMYPYPVPVQPYPIVQQPFQNIQNLPPQQQVPKAASDYFAMVQQLFLSAEFKGSSQQEKRDLIGNSIYETVEKIAGVERAPKVTGMLIDLSEAELNQAISTFDNLEKKVA